MMSQSVEMPHAVSRSLLLTGERIKAARLRRRQTAADLAKRMGVSLPTLRKLERGDPSVSLGTFASALWMMGLLDQVLEAISPESDRAAVAIETSRLPKRARTPREVDLDRL